ncbi:MAG: alpha-L-glutamate ligase-like protein [Opitutales bacterium]|nr:alpha-L-glutamate ligase-like protein [Opitutales bacterium]
MILDRYIKGWISPRTLSKLGVLGINARNFRYIQRYNPRDAYPLVDDKVLTKEIVQERQLKTPTIYAVLSKQYEIAHFHKRIADYPEFVIKPAHGSGGNGILVISGRQGEDYIKASGAIVSRSQVERHLSNILAGLHSLGGQPDQAIIEYRIHPHPLFDRFSFQGVPDIRVLVFLGFPVMAMMRLSTRGSDGKANLHQGAIGVGIDIRSGQPIRAVQRNRPITVHPDTNESLSNLRIEGWQTLVETAAECYPATNLGYMGVDLVVDETQGPMILEMNARPGLSIQLANGQGLKPRLKKVESFVRESSRQPSPKDCVQLAQSWFGINGA